MINEKEIEVEIENNQNKNIFYINGNSTDFQKQFYDIPPLKPEKTPPKSKRCYTKFHAFMDNLFYNLGKIIALRPSYFIIVPVFLTLLAATGIQKAYEEKNQEELFYPRGGPAPYERSVIEEYFTVNTSGNFMPQHITRAIGHGRVLIEAKDKGSIFRKHLWDEILRLNELIQNFTITHESRQYSYKEICAKWGSSCMKNIVLDLYEFVQDIENKEISLSYPVMIHPVSVPMFYGGITLDKSKYFMESAKGINLNYFLKVDTEEDIERDELWENKFVDVVGQLDFQHIHVSRYAVRSYLELTRENPQVLIPYIPYMIILIVVFSLWSTWMMDCVRSKILFGLVGILSTVLSTGTAFGILMYFGVPNTGLNLIIPFIMMGIGLDDVYLILSAWRRTSLLDPVDERLGKAYIDTGASITFTSITNVLSFSLGIIGPIKAVRLFCAYAAMSLIITYLWHLFFFGGCFALAGYLEAKQKHSLLCTSVKSRSENDENRSRTFSLWCSGGVNPRDPMNPKDHQEHVVSLFFKNYIARWLTISWIKGLVLCLYLLYLAGAIYGCLHIKEGLDRRRAIKDGAYMTDYFEMEDTMFRQHPYQIQVVITGELLYHKKSTRRSIMRLHRQFENITYVNKLLSQSWMRHSFVHLRRHPELEADVKSEKDFIKLLREKYLNGEDNVRALEVKFNEDFSRIVASRFILQTGEVKDTIEDVDLVKQLREVAAKSDLNVTVFNANFMHFDQYSVVRPVVIHTIIGAAIAVVLVSVIFIPNRLCSLIVGIAITSIEGGVIGFMSLWDVNIDSVSMIALIMTIGFCVDFSLHISYAFLTSPASTSNEKIVQSLHHLGLPIIQGAFSTVISIAVFVFVPAYAYTAIFKVVILVTSFALFHGIAVIPVILSLVMRDTTEQKSSEKSDKDSPKRTLDINDIVDASTIVTNEKYITKITIDGDDFGYTNKSFERCDPEGCSTTSTVSVETERSVDGTDS